MDSSSSSPDKKGSLDPIRTQFTFRAFFTGMVLASVLSLCNFYTGLKIGWTIGMSLTSALLAFGFWHLVQIKRVAVAGCRFWKRM